MFARLGRWIAVVVFLVPVLAQAQGLLVVIDPAEHVRLPRPIIIWPPHPWPHPIPHPIPQPEPSPVSYKIDTLEVDARVIDQVAKVQVSQSFVNTGSRQMEVSFIFPLPYDGAIDQMTLLVDGKEMPARLLSAEDARRAYEEIVRKNRDPALLEWVGTGMFKTSVFPVPPGAKRTVSLRYVQLCRKQEGMTDFLFPLSTAKYTSHPVEKINFRISVESQEDIKNIYSPTHAVEIKRPDDRHAVVSYTAKDQVPSSDFRLLYDIGRGKVSMRVLTYRPDKNQDGFFLLLASPEIKAGSERPKKTVLLVMDRSGSMSGQKIEQVRAALKHVLNNLREGDLFNVIAFDSEVESFRPELQRYNDKTRREALGFAEGLYAGGSTNINEALRVSLAQLNDAGRPSYVVFLTDGLPTVGESNEMRIVANSKEFNKIHARVFCFGVGYDLNARFLDKLVRENFGQSEYVRPDENIEEHVAKLYNRIESPVLTGMKMRYDFDTVKTEEGSPISRVYPREAGDLFAGDQLVIVGRYKKAGAAKVVLTGRIGDKEEKFDFPATFVEQSSDESLAFVEKLWAVRRVGEILDQIDLKGKNDELVKELVELATRHGILTPYTSFMADETTNIHNVTSNFDRANRRLEALAQTGGAAGTAQRAMKGDFQNARNYSAANDYSNSPQVAEKKSESSGFGRFAQAAPAAKPAESHQGNGSGGYGGRVAAGVAAGPATAPVAAAAQAAGELSYGGEVQAEADQAQASVRNIGNRTFYRRQNQWVDSQVTPTQQQNARKVKQFSKDYFALANRYGRSMSQYLAMDEAVMLNLDGQAYLIEP
ncbi:MAG: VIT and VWA domain-containing protein [Planctomycetota bacterium]